MILESFSRALQVYFIGSSGECKWQPGWSKIYPIVARSDDAPQERERARAALAERADLKCRKLMMNPTACHGCPDNPQGNEQKRLDHGALLRHGHDIRRIERLHDAARMGLLSMDELRDEEFEMLRRYWWEIEKLQASARL